MAYGGAIYASVPAAAFGLRVVPERPAAPDRRRPRGEGGARRHTTPRAIRPTTASRASTGRSSGTSSARSAPAQRHGVRRRRGRPLAVRVGHVGAPRAARRLAEGETLRHDSIVGTTFLGAHRRRDRRGRRSPRSRAPRSRRASTASRSTRATRSAPASCCAGATGYAGFARRPTRRGLAGPAGSDHPPATEMASQFHIVVNYRREDSLAYAGRLYDDLTDRFGEGAVFMDIDAIPAGVDFADVIEQAVGGADVFISLIGPGWLNAVDANGAAPARRPTTSSGSRSRLPCDPRCASSPCCSRTRRCRARRAAREHRIARARNATELGTRAGATTSTASSRRSRASATRSRATARGRPGGAPRPDAAAPQRVPEGGWCCRDARRGRGGGDRRRSWRRAAASRRWLAHPGRARRARGDAEADVTSSEGTGGGDLDQSSARNLDHDGLAVDTTSRSGTRRPAYVYPLRYTLQTRDTPDSQPETLGSEIDDHIVEDVHDQCGCHYFIDLDALGRAGRPASTASTCRCCMPTGPVRTGGRRHLGVAPTVGRAELGGQREPALTRLEAAYARPGTRAAPAEEPPAEHGNRPNLDPRVSQRGEVRAHVAVARVRLAGLGSDDADARRGHAPAPTTFSRTAR